MYNKGMWFDNRFVYVKQCKRQKTTGLKKKNNEKELNKI